MRYRNILFSIALLFVVYLSLPASALSFNTQDLAGFWYGHHVVTGDAPLDDVRWGYGTVSIDGSGNYTASWNSPTQTNEITAGTISISPQGLISINNQALIHGIMNADNDLIVFIDGTSQNDGHGLNVLCKRTANNSFTASNLSGTWYGYQVVSGDRPQDDPRWGYGSVTINTFGYYTATWNSPTQTNEVTTGYIAMNPNGTFILNGQSLTHGVINDSLDLMVFIDGSSQSAGNLFSILLKHTSQTSFSADDLAGTWSGHHVVSGDAPGEDPRWGYGTASIKNNGEYITSWNSPTSSNEVSSGVVQINGNGIISINNQALIHGAMNSGKDLFVFIDGTSQSAGNALTIFTKAPPVATTGPNLLLLQ